MKKKINELINKSNSILLLTHETPDGDAIGSVLAFYHFLISINKTVDMVILDIPKIYNFLPGINNIVDNVDSIYDYVYSYPGNAPFILSQRGEEFRNMIQDKLEKEGAIYIHKSSGMFVGRK